MTDAQIYLEAAKLVWAEETEFACVAIDFASGYSFSERRRCFDAAFSPDVFGRSDWGAQWGKNQLECRVLALLFASAMAKTGDI